MDEHSIGQRAIAEAIGTGLLVFIGAGSVPAIILLESGSKAPFSGADLGFIAVAFGLIVTAMIYTIGKVSGCHINPAVTFALALTKRFPWRELPTYWAAQIAGAIAGAFAIWASFGSRATDLGYGFGVVNFDHSVTSWGSAMFIEALGTAILMFTVLRIVDTRSPEGWAGLIIGVLSSTAPFLLLDGFNVPSAFQLKDVITFLILVLVLIFRPTGLFGGKDREKV